MNRWLCCVFLLLPLRTVAAPAPAGAAAPLSYVLYGGPPTEAPAPALLHTLLSLRLVPLPGGPLAEAGQVLAQARRAFAEMRCGEALVPLAGAEEQLLRDSAVEDARPLLAEVEALLLSCADRVGDSDRAARAADRLIMTGAPVPPDVALTLRRYRGGVPFGPPAPPVQVETDPAGAQVIRNLLKIGAAPVAVPGGDSSVDVLDVELPGFRKVHKPLGSGEKLSIGLRGEDRLGVLVGAAAARPLGSDSQAEALMGLLPLHRAGALKTGRVIVFAPLLSGGAAVPGERLRARVFDLLARRWVGPLSEVAAGSPQEQAKQLLALSTLQKGPMATAPPPRPAGKAAPAKGIGGFRLPFTRAKWYSWVIAGGVVALIAGLLIAERVGSDKITIEASR